MTAGADFVRSDTLRNGLTVTIRPLRSDDRDRIARAIKRLDPESIYTRMFSYRTELTEAGLDRIMSVDPARAARTRGIVTFEADVLAENKSMLAVFARSGLPMRKERDGGTVHVTLSLAGGLAGS